MEEKEIISLLYTIYVAGFNHGLNEDSLNSVHSTFNAFNRLIDGESPTNDGMSYDIKDKVLKLIKN